MKRSRGRNRRSGGNNQNNHNNPNRHYESVGPDVKIRGSAQQVLDKYLQYARDAQTSGDRILSEAYFQFAEHYQRIVAKQQEARDKQQQQRQQRDTRRDDRNRNDNDADDDDDSNEEAEVEARNKSREDSSSDDDEADNKSDDSDDAGDEKPRANGKGSRGRRKPYAKREKSDDDGADTETDGVMKTLSRGRKKASEGESGTEEASAEATD